MSTMMMLVVLLGALLAVLVILMIYRSTLEMHEDDQLFLDNSESQMASEQQELQSRLGKIEPAVRWVGAASALVAVTLVGMWLYEGLNRGIQ